MNLQAKTTGVYLLSLPYNFTSLRQVEGRAWRQGNENQNVRINFMLTNDSIDVFMLQKLQAKQARYLEAMKKGVDILDISDINTQELKTAIITNPVTRANIEIEVLKKKIESEKSRFLADNAFVLRKFEGFTKLKDEVTKAEQAYSKVTGWADENEENNLYWKNQLPSYQKTIDLAKSEVEIATQKLAEKGVNVAEIEKQIIEKQIKIAEDKVLECDQKLENLPDLRVELITLYKLEKEEILKKYSTLDYVLERAIENKELFKTQSEISQPESVNSEFQLKNADQENFVGRKR